MFLVKKSVSKLKEMEVGGNFYSFKKILDVESEDLIQMNII